MKLIRSFTLILAVLLAGLSLSACKTTLTPGDKGLYDKKHDIRYINAPTVYEATGRGEEYGVLKLNENISYDLFEIPGVDPAEMLATEENNIVYASDLTLPSLTEMAPEKVHICVDGSETAHELYAITDEASIEALVKAASSEDSLYENYPGMTPLKNYRVRFASEVHPGFFYTLTYVEYASDVEIDGVNYGRYFFLSATEKLFVPAGDTIHAAGGYGEDTEAETESIAETTAD